MKYGEAIALKVLTGERMGRKLESAGAAKSFLENKDLPINPIFMAQIEGDAVSFSDAIRVDHRLISQANEIFLELAAQYGFQDKEEGESACHHEHQRP